MSDRAAKRRRTEDLAIMSLVTMVRTFRSRGVLKTSLFLKVKLIILKIL